MSELLDSALLVAWAVGTFAAGLVAQVALLIALLVLAVRGLARAVHRRKPAEDHAYAGFDAEAPRGH